MISFGAGMGGGLHIASSLGVTEPSQASWIAASYPLTAGAFILMSGRLGSIYGHGHVLLLGASWWIVWSLINGFCSNFIAFNIARGMSGVGGAMVVPNAVAIIGTTFPPGRIRNRCLGLFGAGAPVGGWAGALMAGLLAETLVFKWLFIFM
jgi:MFS family permease